MSKRKGLKRPSLKDGKHFKIQDITPVNYDRNKPLFSLKHMRYQSQYCISGCQQNERASILDAIQRFSQGTWSEIKGWGKRLGFEPIPHHRFKIALSPILTPDVKILVARYDEAGRIAGFREKDIYHIVLVGSDLYTH